MFDLAGNKNLLGSFLEELLISRKLCSIIMAREL